MTRDGDGEGRSIRPVGKQVRRSGPRQFCGQFHGAGSRGSARRGARRRLLKGGSTGSGGNTVKPGAVFWPGPASWRTCSHRCPLQTQRGKFKLLQYTTNFVRPLKCTTRPEGGRLRVDRKRGFENSFPAWGNCILKFLSLSHQTHHHFVLSLSILFLKHSVPVLCLSHICSLQPNLY